MIKKYYRHIILFAGVQFFFHLLVPEIIFLHAQTSDYDSASLYKELSIEDHEQTEEDETDDKAYFIKKEHRYDEWKPSRQKNIPDTIISSLKKEDAFWYADIAVVNEKRPDNKKKLKVPLGQQSWFRTLIWLLILGGFAFFLITYLAGSNVGLFRKKNVIISQLDEEGEMPENIFAINYQKEIDKAVAISNYRLAVRLMFLRLLKNMSERNIIIYKQDKTNFDYLTELSLSPNYQQFFKVTRNYEYSWYGKFVITEEAFQVIHKDFEQFENKLS